MMVDNVFNNYPVKADIGITIQSLLPIKCVFLLNIGFTSLTPIQSGMSCLFANTNNGIPWRFSFAIILSRINLQKIKFNINHRD